MDKDKARTNAFSLYPQHEAIIECFSRKSGRNPSNAVQFIITQWSEQNPEAWLTIVEGNGDKQEQETAA